MSFPIDIAHTALVYTDGNRSNKFYNVTLLVAATGMSIIIKRWGKANAPGEMKIERFAIQKKAEAEFERFVEGKMRRSGYEIKSTDIKQASNEGELRMAVGPAVWPRIPGPDLQHILPDTDVSGRPKELNAPRFNEDGKYMGEPAPRTFSAAEIRAAKEAEKLVEQQEAVKTYAANPNFGRF